MPKFWKLSGDSPGFLVSLRCRWNGSHGPPVCHTVFPFLHAVVCHGQGLGAADVQSTADSIVCEAKQEEEAPLPLGWKQVWCEEYQERGELEGCEVGQNRGTYCWWFRNPGNSPVEVTVVYPIIYKILNIPGGCLGLSEPSTLVVHATNAYSSMCQSIRFQEWYFWNHVTKDRHQGCSNKWIKTKQCHWNPLKMVRWWGKVLCFNSDFFQHFIISGDLGKKRRLQNLTQKFPTSPCHQESKWTRPKLGEPEEDKTLPKAGGPVEGMSKIDVKGMCFSHLEKPSGWNEGEFGLGIQLTSQYVWCFFGFQILGTYFDTSCMESLFLLEPVACRFVFLLHVCPRLSKWSCSKTCLGS